MPSQSKIKDFCQLSHRESQVCDKHQFQFIALLDRRNWLPNYQVIANQCAHWCGNPHQF